VTDAVCASGCQTASSIAVPNVSIIARTRLGQEAILKTPDAELGDLNILALVRLRSEAGTLVFGNHHYSTRTRPGSPLRVVLPPLRVGRHQVAAQTDRREHRLRCRPAEVTTHEVHAVGRDVGLRFIVPYSVRHVKPASMSGRQVGSREA